MSSLKLFVQLPAIIFYIFITLTVTQAWSNDHVTTYQLTSGNGDPYGTLVIPARSRGGFHLFLTEFIPAREQQQAANRRIGVMRWIPNSDRRGIFGNYREEYHPSTTEINLNDPSMSDVGSTGLNGITLPSYDVFSRLSPSSPVQNREAIILSLPIPEINIPIRSPGRSQIIVSNDIRRPVVTTNGNSRFTVSGYSWGNICAGRYGQHNHCSHYEQIAVQAEFIHHSADGSVRLESIRMDDYITISHVATEESSEEYNALMESFWVQIEKYQAKEEKMKIRQKRRDEYINSLEKSDRKLLEKRMMLSHLGFVTPGEQVEPAERAEQLYQGLQAFMDDENTHTQSADSGGNNAGAESTVPEGDNVGMELEPGTASNGSVSNDPENPRIELLRDGRSSLSLGLQSNLK